MRALIDALSPSWNGDCLFLSPLKTGGQIDTAGTVHRSCWSKNTPRLMIGFSFRLLGRSYEYRQASAVLPP